MEIVQEYAQTGLDVATAIFVVVAFIRVIQADLVHKAALGDPEFTFSNFSYWLASFCSVGGYLMAFQSYFYVVPRISTGPNSLIESSRIIHDNVSHIWAITSWLTGIPALLVLIALIRMKNENLKFALQKLVPVLVLDWGICIYLNIIPI